MRSYLGRVLIALDQLGNTLVNGFPDETFSSRMGRRRKNGDRGANAACVVLDAIQEHHCNDSIEETPTGETDAHQLGHVIHELPRRIPVLIALALFTFGCGFKIPPCLIDGTCLPTPPPTASPSPSAPPVTLPPTPSPVPTVAPPSPSPVPTVAPPASPSPSPQTSPSPSPSGVPPIVDGNYPVPPAGVCPAWFANSLSRIGISELSRRSCGQCIKDGYLGIIITASATPKSVPPFCGHAPGRLQCEQWRPCQDGASDQTDPNLGPDLLMTLPGHWTDARCDKRSDNNYLCHHKPLVSETGVMTFKACPRGASPNDPRCGVSPPVNVP